MRPSSLTTDELSTWIRYIYGICGVSLDNSQSYLIETRLEGLMRETTATGWTDLLRRVKTDGNALRTKVVDAITTHETSFFRDSLPFELMAYKLLPDLIATTDPASGPCPSAS